MKSGEGYDLCRNICGQKNHAEEDALLEVGEDARGSRMYLLGHYYACKKCQEALLNAGIYNLIVGQYPMNDEFFEQKG